MSTVRSRHGASLLSSGKVMVSGGEFFNGSSPFAYNGLNSAEIYDPATNSWASVANMPAGLCYNNQHSIPDGRVVVVAGLSKTNYGSTFSSEKGSTYLYDPKSNTWTSIALNLDGRLNFASTLMANGKVLVTGNVADNSAEILTSLPPTSIVSTTLDKNLEVYPNPTSGMLYIHSNDQQAIDKIELRDMLGKSFAVNPIGLHTQQVMVPLDALANGIYSIQVSQASKVLSLKVMVEK